MQIEMTVPIIFNEVVICEFEAAVDINVLSYGCPAQTSGPPESCYPAEGPEWEVEGTYIDMVQRNEEGECVLNLIECPDELLIFVIRYIEGDEFMDRVCDAIAKDDSYDYRNSDDYM